MSRKPGGRPIAADSICQALMAVLQARWEHDYSLHAVCQPGGRIQVVRPSMIEPDQWDDYPPDTLLRLAQLLEREPVFALAPQPFAGVLFRFEGRAGDPARPDARVDQHCAWAATRDGCLYIAGRDHDSGHITTGRSTASIDGDISRAMHRIVRALAAGATDATERLPARRESARAGQRRGSR